LKKNILKILEKIFSQVALRGIECSRHRHLKTCLKSEFEIHSKSHGNIVFESLRVEFGAFERKRAGAELDN